MSTKQWVFLFDELDQAMQYVNNDWEELRGLFGGKGANLADMHRIGLPVPPGFTVTTEACNTYLSGGGVFPDGMWDQEMQALMQSKRPPAKPLAMPATHCWFHAVPGPNSPCLA